MKPNPRPSVPPICPVCDTLGSKVYMNRFGDPSMPKRVYSCPVCAAKADMTDAIPKIIGYPKWRRNHFGVVPAPYPPQAPKASPPPVPIHKAKSKKAAKKQAIKQAHKAPRPPKDHENMEQALELFLELRK